jgi:hypothetical protein
MRMTTRSRRCRGGRVTVQLRRAMVGEVRVAWARLWGRGGEDDDAVRRYDDETGEGRRQWGMSWWSMHDWSDNAAGEAEVREDSGTVCAPEFGRSERTGKTGVPNKSNRCGHVAQKAIWTSPLDRTRRVDKGHMWNVQFGVDERDMTSARSTRWVDRSDRCPPRSS